MTFVTIRRPGGVLQSAGMAQLPIDDAPCINACFSSRAPRVMKSAVPALFASPETSGRLTSIDEARQLSSFVIASQRLTMTTG